MAGFANRRTDPHFIGVLWAPIAKQKAGYDGDLARSPMTFNQGVDGSIPSGLTNVSGPLGSLSGEGRRGRGNPGAIPSR
jgi:hypothetical protein